MWPFSSKAKAPLRSTIDGATVKALLDLALKSVRTSNYRHLAQKQTLAVITLADVERASAKSYSPWVKDTWECEDQARSLIDTAQRLAANEGRSWAIGTLRADAPNGDGLHVYVWAIVLTEGRFAARDVVFFDPTARMWASAGKLNSVDYSMT